MKFFNFNKSLFKRKQIFDQISGYEEEKWVLEQTLNNEDSTHILLVGPPGIGKTRFLKAIEACYPDLSYFALAAGSTGAGMINHCFENPPRFLLIDEIEDMRQPQHVYPCKRIAAFLIDETQLYVMKLVDQLTKVVESDK